MKGEECALVGYPCWLVDEWLWHLRIQIWRLRWWHSHFFCMCCIHATIHLKDAGTLFI